MKKLFIWLVLMSLCMVYGCSKSVRYSQDEIKDFPPHIQDYIKNSQVAVGMTKQQVRFAWGGPHSVMVLTPSEDGKERVEWVYEKMAYYKSRLIFTDNKLTEIISDKPGFAP